MTQLPEGFRLVEMNTPPLLDIVDGRASPELRNTLAIEAMQKKLVRDNIGFLLNGLGSGPKPCEVCDKPAFGFINTTQIALSHADKLSELFLTTDASLRLCEDCGDYKMKEFDF